jgi:hypothetical protein
VKRWPRGPKVKQKVTKETKVRAGLAGKENLMMTQKQAAVTRIMRVECACGTPLEFEEAIFSEASCPDCGRRVSEVVAERDAAEPAVAARSRPRHLSEFEMGRPARKETSLFVKVVAVCFGLMGIVLLIGAIGVAFEGPAGVTRREAAGQNFDAYYTAEQFVLKQIPGARKVSEFAESVVDVEGNTYRVAMNVDGLNAFGGPVRQALIVEMTLDGGTWRLVGIHHK